MRDRQCGDSNANSNAIPGHPRASFDGLRAIVGAALLCDCGARPAVAADSPDFRPDINLHSESGADSAVGNLL